MPDLDDIRLLHFAAFGLGELPAQSTFYEFKADYWGVEHELHHFDSSLRTALLLDAKRLGGAPTIGLNGNEVYAALLPQPVNGGGNCGSSTSCGEGSGSCEPVPPQSSAGYYCKTGNGADAWVDVFTKAIREGLVSSDDVDFPAVRSILTDLLPRSRRGRQLMAYYYVASSCCSVRTDLSALEVYVQALPAIRKFVRELLDGSDDAAIVTDDVLIAWARIADLHRDAHMPSRERISRSMSRLGLIRLRTRAELMRMLETDGPDLDSGEAF
ncbi:hypothetical protein ACIA5D_27005 [Actinoplanes sp. NPDC051513]|uniref:hypothetical protein n=1 Tax=Actinoplanes sp. NPDC051513 TaxID=3363908 RepID=UPI003788517B